METRKVQFIGGTTYTISLPKQWANQHSIEAGDKLYLQPNGDASLVVHTVSPQEDEVTTAHTTVDGYTDENLRRTVQAFYTAGLDEFTLTVSDTFSTTQRQFLTTAATNLVGLEVFEETESRIVYKNVLEKEEESVRQSVLQLEYVAVWMHRNAVMAVVDDDTDRAKRVIERNDEVNRLFGLVNRQFKRALGSLQESKQLGFDRPTIFDYYTTARQLERVADHAERIATVALRLEEPAAVDLMENFVSLADQSREIVTGAASVLLGSGSVEQAYTAFTEYDELLEAIDRLDRSLNDSSASEAYLLALVLDSVRRTAESGGNIAEAMVQASVRNQDN